MSNVDDEIVKDLFFLFSQSNGKFKQKTFSHLFDVNLPEAVIFWRRPPRRKNYIDLKNDSSIVIFVLSN